MKSFALVCFVLLLVACGSTSTVNPGPGLTVLPTANIDLARHKQLMDDAMTQAPEAAIAGTVITNGEISIPVSRIQIGLFVFEHDQWSEVTRLTTETDGKFSITRKLPGGKYEVRSLDKRYKGKVALTLVSSPVTNLLLVVSK